MPSILHLGTLVFEALLGVFAAYAAYSLFLRTPASVAQARDALQYPHWYWALAGILATIGAVGLLVGLGIAVVGAVAAVWMVGYFVVATFTHVVRHDLASLGAPLLFLACCVGLVALRWGDLAPLLAVGHW